MPQPPVPLRFCATFEPSTLVQGTLLRVEQLSKAFTADRPLFQAMSFELAPHDRLLISGANGAGKSTLLRILAGAVPPDTGTFCWHPHAIVGYLAQEDQCPNDDRTVLQHYRTGRIGYPQDHERELLTYGLVAPEDLHRPVRLLSVGQRRKLALACLLAQQANVLLLDEPTNQLSLELAEQLEQALDVFTGAIILVTHERWLIEHFCAMHCQIAHGQLQRTMI
ncbi:MAG: ABC-F family ATP-binding cassette domain-containing protein [Chloroflexaceae bacterium]|nr:ABC-F family ATP-binding cassette domain-containing protein [Chloroflexaceae bacterium]